MKMESFIYKLFVSEYIEREERKRKKERKNEVNTSNRFN
jgi:hypothetical protein